MEYHVYYRESNGAAWHIIGGTKTRENAAQTAALLATFHPNWTVGYKLTSAKFPGVS